MSEWSSEFAVHFYSSLHDYVIHELKRVWKNENEGGGERKGRGNLTANPNPLLLFLSVFTLRYSQLSECLEQAIVIHVHSCEDGLNLWNYGQNIVLWLPMVKTMVKRCACSMHGAFLLYWWLWLFTKSSWKVNGTWLFWVFPMVNFVDRIFQTKIHVPFLQSHLWYQFQAFSAISDLYKVTNPELREPFTKTVNRPVCPYKW